MIKKNEKKGHTTGMQIVSLKMREKNNKTKATSHTLTAIDFFPSFSLFFFSSFFFSLKSVFK